MKADEARARVSAQNAELEALEGEVARLAERNPGPVLLAIVRALVEMVCASQGDVFRVHNKLKFYRGVLTMLRGKGVS